LPVEQHGSALAPGFKLDRYELLCPIAQGGMAEVWTARQTGKHGFEKLVAVKTILPKFADDERFQRMFLDEAHVSSRIEHPNVAQILDVGEQDDITYLVMEYVDGDALSTLHRAAQSHGVGIPHGILLRLMMEVCGGLYAAHELRMADGQYAGVVHRDVSPHNILVNTKGAAKLIDFGLAKARDRIADETSAGTVKGKLRYMAPEQVLGPSVDGRADVWAVGATLYHLLSGAPPYEADTDVDVVRALMSGRPPRRLGHAVHPAVEAVVQRSLAWRPDERFATARDFQQALEQAMRGARLETSASDVASFLAEHVSDRAQQRQEAITVGMREAAEREGDLGRARASAHLGLLTATPARTDARPGDSWRGPPVSAPPSSGATVVSKRMLQAPERAPRGGSTALATAVVAVVAVVAGLGLAFRLTHPPTDRPAAATAAGLSATTASAPPVAAARAPSVAPARTQAVPPELWAPPAAGSAISMTVEVTDLPVVASAQPPRAAAPAPRPQPPRTVVPPLVTTTGASAGSAEVPAPPADESEDESPPAR
jgi:tRNA A-37 threonylcarbamoyl transferase component Bud32